MAFLIEELHRHKVQAGEMFGNAYVVGWFDNVGQMQQVYDAQQGASRISVDQGGFRLEK